MGTRAPQPQQAHPRAERHPLEEEGEHREEQYRESAAGAQVVRVRELAVRARELAVRARELAVRARELAVRARELAVQARELVEQAQELVERAQELVERARVPQAKPVVLARS